MMSIHMSVINIVLVDKGIPVATDSHTTICSNLLYLTSRLLSFASKVALLITATYCLLSLFLVGFGKNN